MAKYNAALRLSKRRNNDFYRELMLIAENYHDPYNL